MVNLTVRQLTSRQLRTFSDGRDEKDVDEGSSMSLSEKCDLTRLAAERLNVLLDPMNGGDEIEKGVVTGRITILRAQEPYQHTVS